MKHTIMKLTGVSTTLMAPAAAVAHTGAHESGLMGMLHVLASMDHLLMILAVAAATGVAWSVVKRRGRGQQF